MQPALPDLVEVPAGTFTMGTERQDFGTSRAFRDETPAHVVSFTRPLLVSVVPVSQSLWKSVMQDRGRRFRQYWGDDKPAINVSWYNAIRFCNELSLLFGYREVYQLSDEAGPEPGVEWDRRRAGFRLPTESEWEYFTRAGTTTKYWVGDSYDDLRHVEWTGDDTFGELPEVGVKSANPWGLFDTNGLIGEWCWDWYEPYSDSPKKDPTGPDSGGTRVWRGGRWFWVGHPEYYRSADRDTFLPTAMDRGVGLRVVLDVT